MGFLTENIVFKTEFAVIIIWNNFDCSFLRCDYYWVFLSCSNFLFSSSGGSWLSLVTNWLLTLFDEVRVIGVMVGLVLLDSLLLFLHNFEFFIFF